MFCPLLPPGSPSTLQTHSSWFPPPLQVATAPELLRLGTYKMTKAPKDIKIASPNADNGAGRSHRHHRPAEGHHPRCKGGKEPQELCKPTAKAGPAPLSPPLHGTAGADLAALAQRELALRLFHQLGRRWSNCWHRSNRKQLGISDVSTSTGCGWTTAKFIY